MQPALISCGAVTIFLLVLGLVLVFTRRTSPTKTQTSLGPELTQGVPKFLSRKLGGRRLIPVSGQQAGVVLIGKALVEKHYDSTIRFGAHNTPSRLNHAIHSWGKVGIFKTLRGDIFV